MDSKIDQQVAIDEALVPHARRLRIGRSNFSLLSEISSKESTLQLVYDVLRLTLFFKAFLVTTDVLKIYMQEFWVTATVHHHSIRLKMDNKKHIVEYKDTKKSNEMYYPRFTKMFTMIKLVSRHQNMQQFGAMVSIELTNADIRNSDAYKEYYAVATGATPPKTKASVWKTKSSSDTIVTPPLTAAADEGTGTIPGVLDVPTEESDEEISGDDDKDEHGNGEENLGMNDGREEGLDEEEEEDELYRDVNINLGRGIQMDDVHTTQEFEDLHVTLTLVNPDGQQQSSSTPTSVTPLPVYAPTLTPSTIATITIVQQAPTPPTTAPSTLLQDLPNFGLLFGFDHRLKTIEANFSEFMQTNQFSGAVSSIPGIVQRYMDQRMNETVKVAVQIQSDRLRDESQAENNEFLKTIDENMQKIIKEQVKEQVKTSYAVAADLSEMDLKKILIEKIKGNKSIHRSNKQRNLSKALVEAYESDKIILDTYRDIDTLKRRRDDDANKDEEPSAESDRGSKRRREGKELESASAPKEKVTRSTSKSTQGFKSRQMSRSESTTAEEPMQTIHEMEEPSHPEFETGVDDQPIAEPSQHPECIQPWISKLAKQSDSRSSFNELMDTPVDFSAFLMNRLKVDTLTPELLVGPTYELMKGSCKSLVELKFFLEEFYKETTDQLDWVNPEGQQYPHNLLKPLPLIPNSRGRRVISFDHFINNDLEYLRGGASSLEYTTFVTKTKVGDYRHIQWIEDLFYGFAVNRESARDVYSKCRIIDVTELKIVEWYNYKHLDWITVRRDDDKLYRFTEGDFKRLRIQDIEDMLLLLVQGKMTNLTVKECFAFNVALQIDGTLTDVRTALDDRLKGIRMKYLPQTIWRKSDKDRAASMIHAIDKQLKTRRIMRSELREICWREAVRGRLQDGSKDHMIYRMLSFSFKRTGSKVLGEAMLTACYLLNRVWGCRAVVRLPDPKLKTLGERGIKCIFVGYAEHSKAFRFYVIEPNELVTINSIIESRDAIFDENRFSSVPRPSLGIPNGTEDIGGSLVHEEVIEEDDPKTFDEAIKSQDVAFWKEEINDEMYSIMGNNTWVLADLYPCCKPFGCKWIFKRKPKAPKQWHQKFDKVILFNGYLLNQADKCVYSKFDETGKGVMIFLYVDDMLIFGTKQVQVDLTKEFLSSRFSMKDIGEADVILVSKGYTDASWISNTEDNSFTSGWVFLRGGGAISWASQKQTCITGSTMEYEIVALVVTEFVRSQQNLADHVTKGLARDLVIKSAEGIWPLRVTLRRLLPHARGLGFKPRRGGFPSGAKKEWGLSPKAKDRVLHTAQLDVTLLELCGNSVGCMFLCYLWRFNCADFELSKKIVSLVFVTMLSENPGYQKKWSQRSFSFLAIVQDTPCPPVRISIRKAGLNKSDGEESRIISQCNMAEVSINISLIGDLHCVCNYTYHSLHDEAEFRVIWFRRVGIHKAMKGEKPGKDIEEKDKGSSSFTSLLSDDLSNLINQQGNDIDHFIHTQGEELRRKLAEKRQRHYNALIVAAKESSSRMIREKEVEADKAIRRNAELEAKASQLSAEAEIWQSKAKAQEAVAAALQAQLQQAMGGCVSQGEEVGGDHENAEDAESSYIDPERVVVVSGPGCKACGKRVASVVLLPCRHLCVCSECDDLVQSCPLCLTFRSSSIQVYML
nr:BOI-related E3 ubiquitin-protein ligase 1-like [Tanacetum cinerariifolium]